MIRGLLRSSVLVATLVGLDARADEVCGPGNPPCDEPHETPGCLQPQCCDLVCESDLFCCEASWDEACVEIAEELCGEVQCPEEGDCLEAHDTPGCIDEDCCELVRMHDPFCGFGTWDERCVESATEWCAVDPKCPIEFPSDVVDEGEPCLDRINDGCGRNEGEVFSMPLDCGTRLRGKSTTTVPRDVDWFEIPAAAGSTVEVSLRAEFPARFSLVRGDCEGPLFAASGPAAEACGNPVAWSFTAPEGVWYLVVETGIDGRVMRSGLPCDEIDPKDPPDDDEEPEPRVFGLHYLLEVDCIAACPGDLDGDGEVSGADLGILFIDWGPCSGNCPGDLDGDGVVGGADLGLLFIAWGDC